MNRNILFLYQIIFLSGILLILNGCRAQLPIVHESAVVTPYFNFDKVKISITTNSSQYKFKGYINAVKDTSICFRFWGLLGYELGRGLINDNFIFFDATSNNTYTDLKQKMENATGLFLDKSVLFSFLIGDLTKLSENLNALNRDILNITFKGKNELNIIHKFTLNKITIHYTFSNFGPSNISIIQKGSNSKFELNIEIVEFSHEKKICRFSL